MVITMTLSKTSINAAKKQLRAAKRTLKEKCEEFVNELAKIGITVAEGNSGYWGKYLMFSRDVSQSRYGAKAIMSGNYTQLVARSWKVMDEGEETIKTVFVNPLLMAEFGSGKFASDAAGTKNAEYASKYGAGRGTFYGQTHAMQDEGWSWKTLDDEWVHSYGETPSMPMYSAYEQMMADVQRIARQVFGTL